MNITQILTIGMIIWAFLCLLVIYTLMKAWEWNKKEWKEK